MSESELIWKFLSREVIDAHPAVYLYSIGNSKSKQTAITQIMKVTKPIFHPAFNSNFLETIIISFLEYKKRQHGKGEIKIKPIY